MVSDSAALTDTAKSIPVLTTGSHSLHHDIVT